MRHADFGGRVKLGRGRKKGGIEVVTGAGSEICSDVCARGGAEFVLRKMNFSYDMTAKYSLRQ